MPKEIETDFVPVQTRPIISDVQPGCSLVNRQSLDWVVITSDTTKLPVISTNNQFNVFRWENPLARTYDGEGYPDQLRSFVPVGNLTSDEAETARRLIKNMGVFIPYPSRYYTDNHQIVEEVDKKTIRYPVPEHQARGYHAPGVYIFDTPNGLQLKLSVCTKGSGMCGYWDGRRQSEMLSALNGNLNDYPLNPDGFHARDHSGQSVGQKKGDETVWVGSASWTVTKREVEGTNFYVDSGIFSPLCLPVEEFQELPLSTGYMIPTRLYTSSYQRDEKLVYLAKAWANETRIWKNHFSSEKMTAAHFYSAKNDGRWFYEDILSDLARSAGERKANLKREDATVLELMTVVDRGDWHHIIGFAGEALAAANYGNNTPIDQNVTSIIMSINMTENVARAGANRLWGKPVAWHFENVGRFGEVSGGERIYGKATGTPGAMEYHSFFAYLFDAYNAVAIEWAAAGYQYQSIDRFYTDVKQRLLKLNPDHWISCCTTLDDLVRVCQSHYPEYKVNFRSEDAFPLVAVEEATDFDCMDTTDSRWKSWPTLKANMYKFISGVREAYSQADR